MLASHFTVTMLYSADTKMEPTALWRWLYRAKPDSVRAWLPLSAQLFITYDLGAKLKWELSYFYEFQDANAGSLNSVVGTMRVLEKGGWDYWFLRCRKLAPEAEPPCITAVRGRWVQACGEQGITFRSGFSPPTPRLLEIERRSSDLAAGALVCEPCRPPVVQILDVLSGPGLWRILSTSLLWFWQM